MLSAVCLLSVLDLIKKYVVDRGGRVSVAAMRIG